MLPDGLGESCLARSVLEALVAAPRPLHARDELPALTGVDEDGLASRCSGTCLRCQKDMEQQLRGLGGDEERGQLVALMSEENHMSRPIYKHSR